MGRRRQILSISSKVLWFEAQAAVWSCLVRIMLTQPHFPSKNAHVFSHPLRAFFGFCRFPVKLIKLYQINYPKLSQITPNYPKSSQIIPKYLKYPNQPSQPISQPISPIPRSCRRLASRCTSSQPPRAPVRIPPGSWLFYGFQGLNLIRTCNFS